MWILVFVKNVSFPVSRRKLELSLTDQSDWTEGVGALSAQLGWLSLTECLLYFSVDLSQYWSQPVLISATVYWLFQNKNVKLKMSNLEGKGLLEFFKYYVLQNRMIRNESNLNYLAKPAYLLGHLWMNSKLV